MASAAPARRPGLVSDQRGAILIAAVFMATFLVGCLWYVMGVGDAILYRQRMQDGADAVAYAGAVYHARGMNIIAMLNLVMAAILAVLVWLKIAQVLLWSLIAILVGLCFFGGWACGAIPTVKNVESQVQNAIDRVEPIVDKWLKALSKLQGYVARTTPYIAGGRSVLASQGYAPTVEFGLGVSSSMKATSERLGKPAGHDMEEGVYTLPVLATLAAGGATAAELRDLLGQPLEPAERDKALAIVRNEAGIAAALATAERYAAEAVAALADLPATPAVDALRAAPAALIATATA